MGISPKIKNDFSMLLHNPQLIYLDHAATGLIPDCVLDTEREFLQTIKSATHRSQHKLSSLATQALESSRDAIAKFVGVHPNEICFTSGATDALNKIALAFTTATLQRHDTPFNLAQSGDVKNAEILTTQAEHHSNLVPWQELCKNTGAQLRLVPLEPDAVWSIDTLKSQITENTKVITIAHVYNVTGMIARVNEVVHLARQVGAMVVLDACQSVAHMPVDFKQLDVDFAAFSSHKMFGPYGLGVLYGKYAHLDLMAPAVTGGGMVNVVGPQSTTFLKPPNRFEAGTQAVSQIIALAAACNYLSKIGMNNISRYELELLRFAENALSDVKNLKIIGPKLGESFTPASEPASRSLYAKSSLISFTLADVHPHDLSQFLDSKNIAIRSGHHCAALLHSHIGIAASCRASFSITNSKEDISRLTTALKDALKYFGCA